MGSLLTETVVNSVPVESLAGNTHTSRGKLDMAGWPPMAMPLTAWTGCQFAPSSEAVTHKALPLSSLDWKAQASLPIAQPIAGALPAVAPGIGAGGVKAGAPGGSGEALNAMRGFAAGVGSARLRATGFGARTIPLRGARLAFVAVRLAPAFAARLRPVAFTARDLRVVLLLLAGRRATEAPKFQSEIARQKAS